MNLDKLYVLGTNCGNVASAARYACSSFCSHYHFAIVMTLVYVILVDNGKRDGLDKFLKAASSDPETVLHYEFMQDYKVLNHIHHSHGFGPIASCLSFSLFMLGFYILLFFSHYFKGPSEASRWPYRRGNLTDVFVYVQAFVYYRLTQFSAFELKQVPYFCLPANDLVDVIAPSCYR